MDIATEIKFCPICAAEIQQINSDRWRCPECMVQFKIEPKVVEKGSPLTRRLSIEHPVLRLATGV